MLSKENNQIQKCFKSGFTLLEILLVVGIIAILAGIVISAINPSRQLAQARNTERVSDLRQINNALQQYYIDHGSYPASLTATLTEVCNTGSLASSSVPGDFCTGKTDLSVLVPTYLTAIPADPQASNVSSSTTSYKVIKYSSTGKIGLEAVLAEQGKNIVINIPPDPCNHTATNADCWSDNLGKMAWGPISDLTNAQSLTDGSGNTNILKNLVGSYPAADACASLATGGYTWYLPAKEQLSAAYSSGVPGFYTSNAGYYWSSTELDSNWAWFYYMGGSGVANDQIKNDGSTIDVRCLR